ncbi:MAG TPA: HAD family phosphatase [Leptolyngbyaceae cyanobacterium M33_DOE_097]|uniref:HAD family phosphatase n=1 Tax=Oscillatoriales cyanobacterium SpSt-418 TaxID=2282169 RepID=A0A7C3PKT6_9CYAN|nr:HAD family phosphatase [Leptolyngbyaceae cyanobacterium M33_DOE_097]
MGNRLDGSAVRLLVLDIDGTIAGRTNEVSQSVQQAIRAAQSKGVQVAIATGRMYCSALRFYQTVGANLPLMTYQGAFIKDPADGKVHRHWTVPSNYAAALLDCFEQADWRSRLSVHFYLDDELYVRELTDASLDYAEHTGVIPKAVGDLRTLLHREPTKVLAMSDDVELIQKLLATMRDSFRPDELYLTTSVANFFEATNPLVSKGTAVRYLAEDLLGLQPENVMVIGDNFNDFEMIQYAGIGVAMGNAPDGVKAVADWVAPAVELDGAAAAIEEFLLAA